MGVRKKWVCIIYFGRPCKSWLHW